MQRKGVSSQRSKDNLIVFPGPGNGNGPEPVGSAQKNTPLKVLNCTRDEQAYRWLVRGVKLSSIRRALGVAPSEAEAIVREGVLAMRRAA